MKKLLSFILVIAMIATMSAVFTSCGEKQTADDTTSEVADTTATEEVEVLTMATHATFPPYEYKEGDEYCGIDIEIATAIAEKLGMKLQIMDVEFGSIIGGVQTGKFDMGMAGMTVTDERKKSVDFTNSYATGIQAIIVPVGSDIKTVADLKGDGSMKIGVQQDTTGDIYATGDYGDENIVRYKTGNDAVQALAAGKVDAVITDNEPAKSYIASTEGLQILETAYTVEDYAICVSKENTELLDSINNALEELTDDGVIAEIIEKYIPTK